MGVISGLGFCRAYFFRTVRRRETKRRTKPEETSRAHVEGSGTAVKPRSPLACEKLHWLPLESVRLQTPLAFVKLPVS